MHLAGPGVCGEATSVFNRFDGRVDIGAAQHGDWGRSHDCALNDCEPL